jgi:DNA-binding response OmpR family regulator
MKIPRKHILLVESDDNLVKMLRFYLGYSNYRVTTVSTCNECLKLARTERVDLYLLGDGCETEATIELCRKIRALDSNTPIVFCSVDASPADRQRGMSAGAQAFLTKPCGLEELRQTIRCLIAETSARGVARARTESTGELRRA